MDNSILLHEYTEILLGMRRAFSGILFEGTEDVNERTALQVCRYALNIFLRCWDPKAAQTILTGQVIDTMKLNKVLPYIRFPSELDKHRDFFYIAHLLYPRAVPYDKEDLSVKVYKSILAGDLYKFPKKYLDGHDGRERACYCLKYMISHYLSFHDTEEMYAFFSTSAGTQAIREYKLKQACIDIYETPVDFLHDTLPDAQKNEFYFMFYKYRLMQEKHERKLKLLQGQNGGILPEDDLSP